MRWRWLLTVGALAVTRAHSYDVARGYVPQGADLMNGTYSLGHAKQICDEIAECMGITFSGNYEKVTKAAAIGQSSSGSQSALDNIRALVWLKAVDDVTDHTEHVSLVKSVRPCTDLKYMRYKSKGMRCCDGTACPAQADYAATARRCRLPAVTPHGIPRCSNLRGDPLLNVAPLGKASASSEYPYAENAGPGAANDGVVNASLFHSGCDAGPASWALQLPEPMAIHQLVMHNRVDFKSRLYGASVRLLGASGTDGREVLASFQVRTASELYIWQVRPFARGVLRIEVHAAEPFTCLHFRELEVYGHPMGTAQGPTAFTELPETALPNQPTAAQQAAASAARIQELQQQQQSQQLSMPPQQSQPVQSVAQPQPQPPAAGVSAHRAAEAAAPGGAQAQVPRAGSQRTTAHAHSADDSSDPGNAEGIPGAPRGPTSAAAPTPRPGHPNPGLGRGSERTAAQLEDDLDWAATTGSLTAMALLVFQYLWVKARWLDMWS